MIDVIKHQNMNKIRLNYNLLEKFYSSWGSQQKILSSLKFGHINYLFVLLIGKPDPEIGNKTFLK